MTYVLSDSQREILGREMQPDKIDGWVNSVWNAAEERSGSGDAAVEAKIEIIESTRSRHPYDERRRRAYPDIGDQLDALYHAGIFPDEMASKIKAVKDANPK
tara:strand:- start:111 stop:416 length:306 start_codon:yes stop_codon:yes gene_type:complete